MSRQKSRRNKQDNTVLWVLLFILVVCFVVIGLLFYKFFYAGAGSNKYGDRLDGIENYALPDNLSEDIKSIYTEESSIDKVEVNVEGKIIYIVINFVEAVNKDTAENLAIKALEKIGENNLTFYEVQYLITYSGEEENSNFPIFGSKNANSLKVVW